MCSYKPLPTGKLIRYKIPDLHEQQFGVKVTTEEIHPEDPQAIEFLTKKIHEELAELSIASLEQKDEEVADVLTVLQAVIDLRVRINAKLLESAYHAVGGSNPINKKVTEMRERKKQLKGDFSKLIVVISETAPTQIPQLQM